MSKQPRVKTRGCLLLNKEGVVTKFRYLNIISNVKNKKGGRNGLLYAIFV